MSTVRVRFAPSPTGRLHPGNARTAAVNALFARRSGGRFLLRIDDTDREREEPGAVDAIGADLAWLGLPPDEVMRQGERAARYLEAADTLVARGHAYLADGAVRLATGTGERRWRDLVHGSMGVDLAHQNDPVLLRSDGRATYTLASVVDDVDAGITHVIRGDDHLTNTAAHLRLMEALDAPLPAFAHLPLVVDAAGAPLSKRTGALALERLRAAGVEPEPLLAYLAGLGTGRTVAPGVDPAASLALEAFGSAAPTFDMDELARGQERWIQSLDVRALNHRLAARGAAPLSAPVWQAVAGNLKGRGDDALARLARLDAIDGWRTVLEGEITPVIADADRADLRTAAELLAEHADADFWLDAVTAATGRRGKRLRLPIRLALSARSDGPPLADLLALLGPERTRRRLLGERA